ncbi:helix-turn-helix domain-containing protein [Marininema halotolerans]|uniref:Transcriptional regulator, contains XRE-family HTH domain n=1 Tax=Marininema halotolerans TaxID=1155944 RepID=A0A1I6STY3_9BACL|nr:XRE family transcriptional regulator [Marininema halotolerans]SFS80415.1 Transcriptional regulator, contains XRE-family HTH domain [Marininema halotolerans]
MNVGLRLKQYRLKKGYSLQDLSDRSGVSRSMLSKIERGEKNPTINLLCEIVEALQITVSQVIEEPTRKKEIIVTKKDKRPILYDEQSGLERRLLSPTLPSRGVEFVLNILPVGCSTGTFPAHQRNVHEHIYVEVGTLKVRLDESTFILESGDSLFYEANGTHEFINMGEEACRYFLVIDSSSLRNS